MTHPVVAVVIPCFRVKAQILAVLEAIGPEVGMVVVVDDCCPEGSGTHVALHCRDPRVTVIRHDANQGVGGAVLTGYAHAAARGADILVKLDGDGQMDPALIALFTYPIAAGLADYSKGNRFYNIEDVRQMPAARLFGNAVLSFMSKISTGHWSLFDPTNGYTAIAASVFERLPAAKIQRRYFFESDMLFRLGTIGARVVDVPMTARYGDEVSSLKIGRVLPQFLLGHAVNLGKRLVYTYLLRDFSIASLELLVGSAALLFGLVFGSLEWGESSRSGHAATTGTVMLAALPVISGIQMLLSFLAYDMAAAPARALHPLLPRRAAAGLGQDERDGHEGQTDAREPRIGRHAA